MKNLLKKIKWYFAERKAKKGVELAYFGWRVVRSMYPASEFRIEGSVAWHQMQRVFEEVNNANAQLSFIKKYRP